MNSLKEKLNYLAGSDDPVPRQKVQKQMSVDYTLKDPNSQNMDYSLKTSNDFIGSGRKFGQGAPQKFGQPNSSSLIYGGPSAPVDIQKLKHAAMESQKRLETDLLSKFRSNAKPKLMASNALDQLKRDELKMGPIRNVINLDDKKQLCLEEYDDEEMLFFKDQIQNGTYVKPQGPSKQQIQNQKQDIIMQIDDDDELEILSEHLNNDEDDEIQQKGIFNYITQDKINSEKSRGIDFKSRQSTGLNYGGYVASDYTSAIQKTFKDKYFKDTHQISDIKSMAKSNSFLKQKSSVGILKSDVIPPSPVANPTSIIKKSSLCLSKKHTEQKIAYGTPYDFAAYTTKRDLEEAALLIKQKHTLHLDKANKKKAEDQNKARIHKELWKRKRILEAKRQQDEVLDELLYGGMSKTKETQQEQKGAIDGLQALREDCLSDKNEEINIDMEESEDDAEKQEAHQRRLNYIREIQEQRQRDELNEILRKARYENRYNVDELVQPILNLDLINNYATEGEFNPKNQQFPEVPIEFQSTEQYFQIWLELFLYETYNQLINQRNESEKDREISQLYGMKSKNDNSQKNFSGFLQRSKQDQKFIYLKLSEKKDETDEKNPDITNKKKYNFPHLNSLKEFDLLLLSKEELDVKNVKKLTSSKFLKDIQSQPGKMMAMVNQKRQQDKTFLELKVDISHDKYVNLNCSEYDYYEMYVYYFDSMSTRIREFRTVKSAEFYPTAQFILNPRLIPKREPKIQHENTMMSNSLLMNSVMAQKAPNDRFPSVMKKFVETHNERFNSSQHQALIDVSTMKNVDFLLIQGPPGTGKTHTIKGIISMLNHSLGRSKKILVCAPSNAAIDEIVTRLISKGGLFGQNESESIKKVLRIGSFDYEPSEIVKQVLFDTKFQEGSLLLENQEEQEKFDQQKKRWQEDIKCVDKIVKIINSCKTEEIVNNNTEIRECATMLLADKKQIDAFMGYDKEKKIKKVKSYKEVVTKNLADMEKAKNSPIRNMSKVQRKAMEKKIVEQTQIICTTLAMSTNEKLECLKPGDIEYLIVDEACQSVELNNLIPFEHQPQKVILVGDQQQLPATTFSENADKTNYSRSMFERFLKCGIDKVMLEIQYRMDPVIRQFPSSQFYENRLKDGDLIQQRLYTPEYKNSSVASIRQCINPVMFFDLVYSSENESEKSKVNNDEVVFIEKLIIKLVDVIARKSNGKFQKNFSNAEPNRNQKQQAMKGLKGAIGIISPYKSQVRSLKEKLFKLLRNTFEIYSPQEYLEINTVDAFQGREKDIIIFSSVRSNKDAGLGFVNDYRRMNVAITRARHCLYIVGNQSTLNKDKNWRDLITYSKVKNSFREIKSKDDDLKHITKNQAHQSHKPPIKYNKPQMSPKSQVKKHQIASDQNVGLAGLEELSGGSGKSSITKKPLLPNSGKNSIQKKISNDSVSGNDKKSPKVSDSNQSVINDQKIKRKCSDDNEDGQILSSGQLADKQPTEADDALETTTQTKKRKDDSGRKSNQKEEGQLSNSDIQSYQSYSSNKVYGKKLQQLKENQQAQIVAVEPGEIQIEKSKSSERHLQQRQQNGNYQQRDQKQYNDWGKNEQNQNDWPKDNSYNNSGKNDNSYKDWPKNDSSYNNNWGDNYDWNSKGNPKKSNQRYQAPSQQRQYNRAPNHQDQRSQSRHNDWKKRDLKVQYKDSDRGERGQNYYRQQESQPRGGYHSNNNGYIGKRPRY